MTTSLRGPSPRGSASPLRTFTVKSWALGWLGVLGLALVNGAVHRAYEPALGVLRAEQLSNAVLVAAVLPWAAWVDHRAPTSSLREALEVGVGWGALTVAFEVLAGHYLNGDDWRTLVHAYDVSAGRLWPLAVTGIALAPAAARWWRGRRIARSGAAQRS